MTRRQLPPEDERCTHPVLRCPECEALSGYPGRAVSRQRINAGLSCLYHPDATPYEDRCVKRRVPGWTTCDTPGHAANRKRSKYKADKVKAEIEAEARRAISKLGGKVTPLGDPLDELTRLAAQQKALHEWLREQVDRLQDEPIITDQFGIEHPRALLQLFIQSFKDSATALASLIKLDLEGRRVRIQERQSLAVVAAINAAMKRTGIEGDLRGRLIDAVAVELRALEAGERELPTGRVDRPVRDSSA